MSLGPIPSVLILVVLVGLALRYLEERRRERRGDQMKPRLSPRGRRGTGGEGPGPAPTVPAGTRYLGPALGRSARRARSRMQPPPHIRSVPSASGDLRVSWGRSGFDVTMEADAATPGPLPRYPGGQASSANEQNDEVVAGHISPVTGERVSAAAA